MALPPQFLDELRARTPLPALIGRTVRLARSGRQWKGCCPFHGEKTPSFTVYDDHFHCFGCGAHGDAIDWVRQTRRLKFTEAIEYLMGSGEPQPFNENILSKPNPARGDDRASVDWAERIWRESISPE